ncbi:MAG: cell division inhibitor SulA [Psychromonas sp.]|jgi:cell division inhibitor SulA|uniref:SulA-like leucine-rich domain-containing protein n=1 Tax=Psychromonas sp. TaxID=1884585 RepID=UPI0039E3D51B
MILSNYMQVQAKIAKQTQDLLINFNGSPYLNLSYDLENYHTLLTHIAKDQDPRWILFIAPPGKPNFTFLEQAGINKSRIISLGQSKITDQTELLKTALKSNNYATVITWLNGCDQTLQDEINALAASSNSTCFIYCTQ